MITNNRGCHGHDCMVVGFTTTYAISAYHHWKLCVEIPLMARCTRYNICDKVCQWLPTGRWFSPGTLVSSTNKTDRHDIAEILLKVVLNTINHNPYVYVLVMICTNTEVFYIFYFFIFIKILFLISAMIYWNIVESGIAL